MQLLFLIFLALVFGGEVEPMKRTYRNSTLQIGRYDNRISESVARTHHQRNPKSTTTLKNTPWLKPLLIGSGIILFLAVLFLSVDKKEGQKEMFSNLTLWVFALPLGAMVVCILIAVTLHLITIVYDKAAVALKDCKFELIFLAVFLFCILFTYAYISALKKSEEESFWVSTFVSPFKSLYGTVLQMVIIGDYLYIAVEWLKKNHLTVLGFSIMTISFYLLYALPG